MNEIFKTIADKIFYFVISAISIGCFESNLICLADQRSFICEKVE